VLVETKVDVRDAATWNHVESIINRIDGSGTSTQLRPSESASALGASVNTTETVGYLSHMFYLVQPYLK
jgi:hypothetical protein